MIDITTLSREEQLQLLEDLWDRLSLTPEEISLTDGQREGISRGAPIYAKQDCGEPSALSSYSSWDAPGVVEAISLMASFSESIHN